MSEQINKKRKYIVALIIVLLLIGATILTVVLLNNRKIEGEELAYRDTGNVEKEDLTISKAELQTLINEAKTLESEKYTDDTWLALLDELISAESVYSDGEATKNKIDATIKSIREKINTLVTRSESTTEELESSENQGQTQENSSQRPTVAVDKLAPEVTVEYSNNGKPTNKNVVVTITTNEDTKLITSWKQVTRTKHTKTYKVNMMENVVVEDLSGNKTEIKIEVVGIDKEAPLITGIKDGEIINTRVLLTITDKNLKGSRLNDVAYTSGTEIATEGKHKLVARDTAGNETIVNFEIDKTAPKVTGITDGAIVNASVTLTITDANLKGSKLNDVDYISGTEITAEGEYNLVVKDIAG
ncbi:MAG: hypothetical protein PHR25_03545, partial [Clostridia bacterium]|nr:hypothetical protein [Clostridia bacterium]